MEIIDTVEKVIAVDETSVSGLLSVQEGKAEYNQGTGELTVTVNKSPNSYCWNLVYADEGVLGLFGPGGITNTVWNLFCGTEEECLTKIAELGFVYNEDI